MRARVGQHATYLRARLLGEPALPNPINAVCQAHVLSVGICCSEVFSATRSRAFPEAWLSRPAARSISRIDFNSARIDREQIRLLQKIGDHLLASLQFSEITQRLQNPRAQFACAHGRDGAIKHTQQTRVARAARFDQLKVGLCGGVEQDVIRRRIAAQRSEMVDFAPQLMLSSNARLRQPQRPPRASARNRIRRAI